VGEDKVLEQQPELLGLTVSRKMDVGLNDEGYQLSVLAGVSGSRVVF
jgi:hypothetical protein